jgi:hypothetical protein
MLLTLLLLPRFRRSPYYTGLVSHGRMGSLLGERKCLRFVSGFADEKIDRG